MAQQQAADGRPVSAATLTRVKATLRAALNAAVRAGYLARNPATYISCGRRAGPGRRCGRRSGSRRGKKPGSGRPWRCGPPRRPRRSRTRSAATGCAAFHLIALRGLRRNRGLQQAERAQATLPKPACMC